MTCTCRRLLLKRMDFFFQLLDFLKRGLSNVTIWNFIAIIIAGAFGGLLSAIHLNDGKLISPEVIKIEGQKRGQLFLGFWADVILGAGAGLIATIPLDIQFPKCIYVAIIAGFGGGNFIAKQAKETAEAKAHATGRLPDFHVGETADENGLIDVETNSGEGDGK